MESALKLFEELTYLETAIEATDLAWNNKFKESSQIIGGLRKSIPRLAIQSSEASFIVTYLTSLPEDIKKAIDTLKETRELGEAHMKYYEKGTFPPEIKIDTTGEEREILLLNLLLDARLVVCDALMFSAVTLLLSGSYVKGVLQLHKSYKLSEETIKRFTPHAAKLHPELVHGMHFDVGFFLFALSIIPTKYLKFVQLAGFRADREEGLRHIRGAYEASRLRHCFAALLLLYNDVLVPRGVSDVAGSLEEARGVCARAIERYPEGSVWRIMGSQTEKKMLNPAGAQEHFRVCLEVSAAALGSVPTLLKYEHATLLAMTLDIDGAVAALEGIMKEQPPFKMYTTAAALLAGCYIIRNERAKAEAIWKDIVARFAKSSAASDAAVVKMFNTYLAGSTGYFVFFEALYFRRDLSKMASLGDRLLDALNAVAKSSGIIDDNGSLVSAAASPATPPPAAAAAAPSRSFSFRGLVKSLGKSGGGEGSEIDYLGDSKSTYLLLKAVTLKAIRSVDDAEAVALLEEVVKRPGGASKWQRPYAYFELCESMSKMGAVEKAVEYLKKCIECKDYPWEDPLKVRIRVTTEQLNRMATGVQISDDSSSSSTSPAIKNMDDEEAGDSVPVSPK